MDEYAALINDLRSAVYAAAESGIPATEITDIVEQAIDDVAEDES